MISHGGFAIISLFDCTMRMTTSDADSLFDCVTTFECPSSDNHWRIDEAMYGSLPLTKTADTQTALVLMSVPIIRSKCGCLCCGPAIEYSN